MFRLGFVYFVVWIRLWLSGFSSILKVSIDDADPTKSDAVPTNGFMAENILRQTLSFPGSNVLHTIPVCKDTEMARVGAKGIILTANCESYLLRLPSAKG